MCDVSVFIRSRNEEKLIGDCLARVFDQEYTGTLEVVVLDSGSTDRTTEVCRQFPVRLVEQPAKEFNYGRALNWGVRNCRGRVFVPLSAHAVPVDNRWLPTLVDALDGTRIGAAFSRQVPWEWCHPVEKEFLLQAFPESDHIEEASDEEVDPFSVIFSNASAAMFRELVEEVPFCELPWAEDRVWAASLLRRGFGIAYVGRSAVLHSHAYGRRFAFRTSRYLGWTKGMISEEERRGGMVRGALKFARRFPGDAKRWYRKGREEGLSGKEALVSAIDCASCVWCKRVGFEIGLRAGIKARKRLSVDGAPPKNVVDVNLKGGQHVKVG